MTSTKDKKTNAKYFGNYNNLQYAKHTLIEEYLKGWYPKLGLGGYSGRILYIDTHAGRGKHDDGQSGSPVVAIQTLLGHSARDAILAKSEVRFCFFEYNEENVSSLRTTVAGLGKLPDGMVVDIESGDCFEQLTAALDQLEASGQSLAAAFVFVDPFGFKLPSKLMRRLLNAGPVELFVNIMWRELFLGISQAWKQPESTWPQVMTDIFGSDEWKAIDHGTPQVDRENQVIKIFSTAYGAKWATAMRMLQKNGTSRYLLAHFSNHPQGRILMKDCMWKVCPSGGFYAHSADNPDQKVLIKHEPDLSSLEAWVAALLSSRPHRWSELEALNLHNLWRNPHLNQVIKKLGKSGVIEQVNPPDKLTRKANPLLQLSANP